MDAEFQSESLEKWIECLVKSNDGVVEQAQILDLFDVGLFLINTDGEILFSNKTFNELFKGNILLKRNNFFKLLSSPPAKKIFDSLKNSSQFYGEISWANDTRTKYGDLRLKSYQVTDTSVLVGSLRDITHRKNNEKQKALLMQDTLSELSSAQDMLMESTKLATIGKLSLEINHELQMPLQVIIASQNFLAERLKEINVQDEELSSIIKEVNGAAAKIRRQLDTITAKSSSSKKEDEVVNSGDVILNSINYFSHKSKSKNIKVLAEIRKNFSVKCNYDKFENVILNLIRNSFDAHSEDESTLKERYIKVSSFDDSNHYQITVEDNGPGVPDKVKYQIFEPFFSTKSEDGTGIGLSLSRRYIEELGGDIFLNQGSGITRFQISIPKEHYEE
jgi:C4-dicarboxylate-specific signal transduction histidine kinase